MASARLEDTNGYIEIKGNPLTKEGVYSYRDTEIGTGHTGDVVKVYRPASELEAAAETFKLLPLVDDHAWLGRDGIPPEKWGVLGAIGEEVYFDPPYLRGNIRIFAEHAKNIIDAGKIELSAGYRSDYIKKDGVFNGEPYQYVQTNIRANHIAIVDEGRSGSDVAVLDQKFTLAVDTATEVNEMEMDLKAILGAIAALSDEEKEQVKAALIGAPDATMDEDDEEGVPEEVPTEAAVIANEAAEDLVKVAGEDDPEKAKAQVEEIVEKVDEIKEVLSMDAMIKIIGERDRLAKSLFPHIGTFDYSTMTEEEVARYGLKKMGVKAKNAKEACKAILQIKVADSAKKTVDSAKKRERLTLDDFYKETK